MSDYQKTITRQNESTNSQAHPASLLDLPPPQLPTKNETGREAALTKAQRASLPESQNNIVFTPEFIKELNYRAAGLEENTRSATLPTGTRSVVNPGQGIKHDQEKEPIALLSRRWLLGVAKVMGFGAKKYAAHNWRGGIERSRLLSAALRHIFAYNEGEDKDPETGLSHLDHASCCLMFARELHDTRPDLDDRYKHGK